MASLAWFAFGGVVAFAAAVFWLRARTAALAERAARLDQARAEVEQRLHAAQEELRTEREAVRREGERAAQAVARAEALAEQVAQLERLRAELEASLTGARTELRQLDAQLSALTTQREEHERRLAEQQTLLEQAQQRLADAFRALSAEALRQNNEQFLKLAQQTLAQHHERAEGALQRREQAVGELVRPLRESLERVDARIQELEKAREGAYASLREQVQGLVDVQERLRRETAQLVTALRAPQVRGRWGEVQLRRVVELAGMVNYCDFEEQVATASSDGRLRPDMVIRLPNQRRIVVDAKAPLQAFLEALEVTDEEARLECLRRHAAQVRTHLRQLGQKSYTQQFDFTPEFVVLFLPGETFFSAALQHDPGLIEHGVEQGVILATPTTLIALLKAVHYGWRQEQLAENAQQIRQVGEEMYRRTTILADHLAKLGQRLDTTVRAYNDLVGSYEARFLPQARRFQDLGAATRDALPDPVQVERTPRVLISGEGDGASA